MEENEQTIETTEEGILLTTDQTEEPILIEIPEEEVIVEPDPANLESGSVEEPAPPITTSSIKSGKYSASALAYQTGSGGSYVSNTRWIIYSDGSATAIMNGQNPYYKYTRTGNAHFSVFKVMASDLRKSTSLQQLGEL